MGEAKLAFLKVKIFRGRVGDFRSKSTDFDL